MKGCLQGPVSKLAFFPANGLFGCFNNMSCCKPVFIQQLHRRSAFAESIHYGYIFMWYRAFSCSYIGDAVPKSAVDLVFFSSYNAAGFLN